MQREFLMSNIHPSALPTDELLTECEIKKTRRGGPGGQHRNKVETAIVITHLPTKIVGQASERRSQLENREVAIERLRLNLAIGFRQTVDAERSPSKLWISRRRGQKISVSAKHFDFPTLIAEAMDFLASTEFDATVTSARLGVSTSQLVKLLKLAPPAFVWLNRNRIERKMGDLK